MFKTHLVIKGMFDRRLMTLREVAMTAPRSQQHGIWQILLSRMYPPARH